ncbi:hypothetical protein BP6252_11184 [Coleophoma cylindrospora]|uniref:Xylanolytic transcriptional activator regulatory domain-containing protein n=1 Tax=Coleophoma cylindrospora TaxID=1849047 RepID=A0A3D8QPB3_9HELO|nr:hypothetical protein BP6252_11184 [Coleophoma cylindrospora]
MGESSNPVKEESIIAAGNDLHNDAQVDADTLSGGSRVDDQLLDFVRQQEAGAHNLGHTFWTGLSQEIGGIRQLLEDTAEVETPLEQSPDPTELQYQSNFLFHGNDFDLEHPSELHCSHLIRCYFSNVHPLCMILHRPTARLYLESSRSSPGQATTESARRGLDALRHAVYFAAVTSMSPAGCMQYLGASKETLVMRYLRSCEAALSHADFLNSVEIATLQALVIYITAIRSHSSNRSGWSLIGLVVRLAHSLNLHRDGDGRAFSPFDAEMRRRLWWHIIVLDIRASEDRATEPMIYDGSFNTSMPRNLNDSDFGPTSGCLPKARIGTTDMTFSLICMDVSNTCLVVNYVPPRKQRVLSIAQQEDIIKGCTGRIDSIYLAGSVASDPKTWVVSTIGQLLILRLWLVVQYPLQSVRLNKQYFPSGLALRTATLYLALRESLEESEYSTGHRWFFQTYVPWHALAVALVALCKQTKGPLVEQAWSIIDQGFEKWGGRMADSQGGILWSPIKSLMRKARAARETYLESLKRPPQRSVSAAPLTDGLDIGLPRLSLEPHGSNSLDPFLIGNFESMHPTILPCVEVDSTNTLGNDSLFTDFADNSTNWDENWNDFLLDAGTFSMDPPFEI